jgi:hypothetical protein
MALRSDISDVTVKLNRVVQGSKLGKHITDSYLFPILDQLDAHADALMNKIGEEIVSKLIHRIMSNTPSGKTYKLINVYGPGEYEYVGTHQASAPGQPPAQFTGTLASSIEFRIDSEGRVRVGIFDSPGTEMSTLFFRGDKIFLSPSGEGSKTPVTTYAAILDDPSSPWYRPWLKEPMEDMRPKIRKIIREEMKKALNRATRSKYIRKAVYFRVFFRD